MDVTTRFPSERSICRCSARRSAGSPTQQLIRDLSNARDPATSSSPTTGSSSRTCRITMPGRIRRSRSGRASTGPTMPSTNGDIIRTSQTALSTTSPDPLWEPLDVRIFRTGEEPSPTNDRHSEAQALPAPNRWCSVTRRGDSPHVRGPRGPTTGCCSAELADRSWTRKADRRSPTTSGSGMGAACPTSGTNTRNGGWRETTLMSVTSLPCNWTSLSDAPTVETPASGILAVRWDRGSEVCGGGDQRALASN